MGNTADRMNEALHAELEDMIRTSEYKSVRAFALALGKDYHTYRRWLRGERDMPLSVLYASIEALNVGQVEFFTRIEARVQRAAAEG